MANFKVSDVTRTASLLKKLVEKSDVNLDGAVRARETHTITPKGAAGSSPTARSPGDAVYSVQRFALSKGSAQVADLKKAVDEIARRVRAADKDGDGFIDDKELKKLASGAERTFVLFGKDFGRKKLDDFNLPAQQEWKPPRFSWKGTPAEVCSSLLNAFSDRKNDNFWASWAAKGPSRYVLTEAEAKKMVAALAPLYASRQKSVLAELSSRSQTSTFGCVSVNPGARRVFETHAKDLGLTGLDFKSPAAPRQPAP